MKEKIAKIFKSVFAIGQICLILVVLVIICAYTAAFIVGGEFAIALDAFVYANIFPVLYFIAVALAFVGIIYIYLTGYRTMRFDTD